MLGYQENELQELKAYFTVKEICQQPNTWIKTFNQIKEGKEEIQRFIDNIVKEEDFDIIFTGAGTSEFVGNSLYAGLNEAYAYKLKSYATTDIVAAPEFYLSKNKPTLIVSFARSGNSPESLAAIECANTVCSKVYHLFITCNAEGQMAKWSVGKANCLSLVLTPETCDQSFAMTSSFSNMLLAAYLCLTLNIDSKAEVDKIIASSSNLLNNNFDSIKTVIKDFDFSRIVYLGSNTLKGIAQESALKMLELTAGRVVTMFDSPLGFRHGPKSIIDPNTLIVVYISDDEYSQKYEIDLIKEMAPQRKGNKILAISNAPIKEVEALVDYVYVFKNTTKMSNIMLGLNYVGVAQLIATFKSLALDINPDNPCPTGEVNRVVKGVTIYPYK